MSTLTLPAVDRPHLAFRGREIPVVLPSWRDPRLRLSAVIMTLQVLGQTVLDFKLSIAQILVTIGVSAIIEIVVAFRREGMLIWPASAILTGNSVAFILRASGTKHGDWWSLNGIHWFLLAAVLSLLSKYLVRPAPAGATSSTRPTWASSGASWSSDRTTSSRSTCGGGRASSASSSPTR